MAGNNKVFSGLVKISIFEIMNSTLVIYVKESAFKG